MHLERGLNMGKTITIEELASICDGYLVRHCEDTKEIIGSCSIDNYLANHVSFIKNYKYLKYLYDLNEATLIIAEDIVADCLKYPQNHYIIVKDVPKAIIKVQEVFYKNYFLLTYKGISPQAFIDSSVRIGSNCFIAHNVTIGKNVIIEDDVRIMPNSVILDNVTIGRGTFIYPNVCIYNSCKVGEDCLIHAGVVIGIDGFRFEHDILNKKVIKMYHAGSVVIGNRVEIGANTTIDRATFENTSTLIGNDVKIDNLVHIGHNITIGSRTTIAASSCIGGSTLIGEDVWIGIGVTISNNIKIGDRAKLLVNAVIARNVPADATYSGFYAMPHEKWTLANLRLQKMGEDCQTEL
jgi:UDP-3-O-[3-hydroxymyristoyl] glucosamine N-acyltransferase